MQTEVPDSIFLITGSCYRLGWSTCGGRRSMGVLSHEDECIMPLVNLAAAAVSCCLWTKITNQRSPNCVGARQGDNLSWWSQVLCVFHTGSLMCQWTCVCSKCVSNQFGSWQDKLTDDHRPFLVGSFILQFPRVICHKKSLKWWMKQGSRCVVSFCGFISWP